MLRLAASSFALLWPAAAWADPATDITGMGVHAATSIADSGLYGAIAILAYSSMVALIVWQAVEGRRKDRALDAAAVLMQTLNDKRAEEGISHAKLYAEASTATAGQLASQTSQIASWADRVQGLAELSRPVNPALERVLAALDRNAAKMDTIADRLDRRRADA